MLVRMRFYLQKDLSLDSLLLNPLYSEVWGAGICVCAHAHIHVHVCACLWVCIKVYERDRQADRKD